MLSILFLCSSWEICLSILRVRILLRIILLINKWTLNLLSLLNISSSIGSLIIFLSVRLSYLALISTRWQKDNYYLWTILTLLVSLILAFSSSNLLGYYFFFEFSLIPTLILIITWGYQPERLISGVYIIIYTVGASLPFLIFLLMIRNNFGRRYIRVIFFYQYSLRQLLLVSITLAFLVKLPIYGVHLWLPKAHVEAPLAGSIILAGILLKLGGYGLWLFIILIRSKVDGNFLIYLITGIRLWGGFLASVMCLRQVDVKSFVAYSSVRHIRLVIAGFFLNSEWGVTRAKITIFAHGFTSSCLFVLAYYSYKKVNSRSLNLIGGYLAIFPYLSLLWFTFCCINIAAPPFLNLLGEMFIIPSLSLGGIIILIVMGIIIFISALYNIYLYTNVNHGTRNYLISPSENLKVREISRCFFHILPIIFLFNIEVF